MVCRVVKDIFVEVDVHSVFDSVRMVFVTLTVFVMFKTSVEVQFEFVVTVVSEKVRVTLNVKSTT